MRTCNKNIKNLKVARSLGMISGAYAKIDDISNLNNYVKSKYFFLKLHLQIAHVDSISPYEFQKYCLKIVSFRHLVLKTDRI